MQMIVDSMSQMSAVEFDRVRPENEETAIESIDLVGYVVRFYYRGFRYIARRDEYGVQVA